MTCFVVTVYKNEEKIVFPRVWAETKVDACMEQLTYVKQFFKMNMKEFAEMRATAKVNRNPMGV